MKKISSVYMANVNSILGRSLLLVCCSLAAAFSSASELVSKAPEGAEVYIIEPKNGAVVPKTFVVKFGLKGMGVSPAGFDKANTGHHHILIDLDKMPDMSTSLPATEQLKHFGGGQTETELTLAPGTHTLQLLLGNYLHIPHSKPVLSEKITITVK